MNQNNPIGKLLGTALIGALIWGATSFPGRAAVVPLQQVTSDFSQPGQPAAQAIDGVTSGSGGWAIYPFVVGPLPSRTLVVETQSDLGTGGSLALTFTLTQAFGRSELLGKFRLSYTTDNRSTFADGLGTGGDITANWVQLVPLSASGPNTTIFTINGDNSITAGGTAPFSDVYTVQATTTAAAITGFRLEAISDGSFLNGPGRSDFGDGNFVLTEFAVAAVAVPEPSSVILLGLSGLLVWRRFRPLRA